MKKYIIVIVLLLIILALFALAKERELTFEEPEYGHLDPFVEEIKEVLEIEVQVEEEPTFSEVFGTLEAVVK